MFMLVSISPFAKIIQPPDRHINKRIKNNYTGAPCAGGQQKATLKCAVLSHNTMPQMSQVLRERAIGMLTTGMSTRAVAI